MSRKKGMNSATMSELLQGVGILSTVFGLIALFAAPAFRAIGNLEFEFVSTLSAWGCIAISALCATMHHRLNQSKKSDSDHK